MIDWDALLAEAELRTSRSSGPGGQHANVTASRVEAVFDVAASQVLTPARNARVKARTGPRVTAGAQETRSRARHRDRAPERLRERLTRALHVPRSRRPTRPTKASRTRRIEGKRRTSERKQQRRWRPED